MVFTRFLDYLYRDLHEAMSHKGAEAVRVTADGNLLRVEETIRAWKSEVDRRPDDGSRASASSSFPLLC